MSDPVRIVVGSGESAEIRVASSGVGAEVRVPETGLIVGPPSPAGEDGATFFPEVSEEGVISWTNDGGYDNPEPVNIKGPAGNDGSDGEDGADGVSPAVSFTTITGGHTMTVTDKDHPEGQSINIMDGTSGGGGTSDYDELTDKPSINNVTLSGNKTAADLGLGTYSKPSGGIPQTDLASAVQSKLDNTVVVSDTQPTATENKLWVDTDASAGSTYQVPTVAEMEAADAQLVNYTEYTLTKLSTATNWTIIRYHACKLGKIAFLQIVASVTADQNNSGVRIFELPADLHPRYGYETRFTSSVSAFDVNVNITTQGNVAFSREPTSKAGNIRMDFCYPTN